MKTAFITGITGQDGSYLAEFLLSQGYIVHGLVQPSSSRLSRLEHLYKNKLFKNHFVVHHGGLGNSEHIQHLIKLIHPDEVYNLASTSDMQTFSIMPEQTTNITALGPLRLLEAIRMSCPKARLFQATSAELFGNADTTPQTEETRFSPRSLYGIAKLYSFLATTHYRKEHALFACNGILFNHTSPRRDASFVCRKITLAAVRIKAGLQDKLVLGNLDTCRDWGYAKDFVEGMWKILQLSEPEDFILATGQTTTVRKFVELAFLAVGIEIVWKGCGIDEKGIDAATKKILVEVSPEFFRTKEHIPLVGNPSKAKKKIDWVAKVSLEELVQIMIESDEKLFSST